MRLAGSGYGGQWRAGVAVLFVTAGPTRAWITRKPCPWPWLRARIGRRVTSENVQFTQARGNHVRKSFSEWPLLPVTPHASGTRHIPSFHRARDRPPVEHRTHPPWRPSAGPARCPKRARADRGSRGGGHPDVSGSITKTAMFVGFELSLLFHKPNPAETEVGALSERPASSSSSTTLRVRSTLTQAFFSSARSLIRSSFVEASLRRAARSFSVVWRRSRWVVMR